MLAALIGIVLFIIATMVGAMILIMRAQRPSGMPSQPERDKKIVRKSSGSKATYRYISDLIKIDMLEDGIFYVNGIYVGLARLSGTNFDVMSEGEQNAREDILIGIQNLIGYPIMYITGTVIADTDKIAQEIRLNAESMTNEKLANYSNMYAHILEEMKKTRYAMSQVTWVAVSDDGRQGNPIDNIRNKMMHLHNSFIDRAGIVLIPLFSVHEGIDAISSIMLPEKLTRPSDMLSVGGGSPIKFNIREIENIA